MKSSSVLGNAVSAVGKKSILAFWRQIHLKIPCQPPGTWGLGLGPGNWDLAKSVKSNTKVTEGGKNHPAAGHKSTRSQNSCQIEFSSRNGREIRTSVYGTTRCPQLKVPDCMIISICICPWTYECICKYASRSQAWVSRFQSNYLYFWICVIELCIFIVYLCIGMGRTRRHGPQISIEAILFVYL